MREKIQLTTAGELLWLVPHLSCVVIFKEYFELSLKMVHRWQLLHKDKSITRVRDTPPLVTPPLVKPPLDRHVLRQRALT